jgi:puromycin-sensitive aminopeptidase
MRLTGLVVMWTIIACSPVAARGSGTVPVVPLHYSLVLTPDFGKKILTGEESVELRVSGATSIITLNAVDISFDTVRVVSGSRAQAGVVTGTNDTRTISVKDPVGPGPVTIHINYRAPIRDNCCGFYAVRAANNRYGVLHSAARRVFPSFDDPAMKATFDVSVVADTADQALSNGVVVTDTPGPGAMKHTIRFSRTAKISTYLVTLVVGRFQCHAGSSDGIPIRLCGAATEKRQATFGLQAAEAMLRYYNRYFGTKYPFGKLDIVGLPDIPGAMESAGCILALDAIVFVDPATAPEDALKNTAVSIAHEIGHQWFGNLVTMKSWNEAWLSEGLSTWISYKAVAAWKPAWNVYLNQLGRIAEAMNLDSVSSTPPVRSFETPGPIAYDKSAAVVQMVEGYIGESALRKGLQSYIKRHAYGNARGEDLWREISARSGKPVDQIMASFITQPGIPAVTISRACQNGDTTLTFRQQRYILNRPAGQTAGSERWSIPVCVGSDARRQCHILSKPEERIVLKACEPVFVNTDARGYYRSVYDSTDFLALAAANSGLSAAERVSLINDAWAAVRAERVHVGAFLNVTASMANETAVLPFVSGNLEYLREYIVSDADRDDFDRWGRTTFGQRMRVFQGDNGCDAAVHRELVDKLARSTNARERIDATSRLALCEDPQLIEQTWALVVSGKLSNAEARNLRSSLFLRRAVRPTVWQLLQRDWKEIEKHGLVTAGLFNQDLAQFCDSRSQREITAFFQSVALTSPQKMALDRALNRVAECAVQRDRLQPQLHSWLKNQ